MDYDDVILKRLAKTMDCDGAILIDPNGNIINSGVRLAYKDDEDVLRALLEEDGNLGALELNLPTRELFGFKQIVGTRHISAICFSYRMPETMVYIVREEVGGTIRVFEIWGLELTQPIAPPQFCAKLFFKIEFTRRTSDLL